MFRTYLVALLLLFLNHARKQRMTEKCWVVALTVLFPVTELTGVALLRMRGVFSVKKEQVLYSLSINVIIHKFEEFTLNETKKDSLFG